MPSGIDRRRESGPCIRCLMLPAIQVFSPPLDRPDPAPDAREPGYCRAARTDGSARGGHPEEALQPRPRRRQHPKRYRGVPAGLSHIPTHSRLLRRHGDVRCWAATTPTHSPCDNRVRVPGCGAATCSTSSSRSRLRSLRKKVRSQDLRRCSCNTHL